MYDLLRIVWKVVVWTIGAEADIDETSSLCCGGLNRTTRLSSWQSRFLQATVFLRVNTTLQSFLLRSGSKTRKLHSCGSSLGVTIKEWMNNATSRLVSTEKIGSVWHAPHRTPRRKNTVRCVLYYILCVEVRSEKQTARHRHLLVWCSFVEKTDVGDGGRTSQGEEGDWIESNRIESTHQRVRYEDSYVRHRCVRCAIATRYDTSSVGRAVV